LPKLPRTANGLLDGLLRGRVWVACVGILLVGIVFLNVSLLGMNSGIAVTADQIAELRLQNADLRLEVAKLGSSERIQAVAESRGFVMPAPDEVTYVDADPAADRTAALALGKVASGVPVDAGPVADGSPAVADAPAPVEGSPTDVPLPDAPAEVAPEAAGTVPAPTDAGEVAGTAPELPAG
jgi:cell division protein FtsL